MIDTALLEKAIADSGVSKTHIANRIGCSRPRLYNILEKGDCTVSEMESISDAIHLTKQMRDKIFFAKKVVSNTTEQ